MKYLIPFICAIILQSCNFSTSLPNVVNTSSNSQTATVYGHWKCDNSGTVKAKNGQGQWETKNISSFYQIANMHPMEFKFMSNGNCTSIVRKTNGTLQEIQGTFEENYNGDANKIMITFQEPNGKISKANIKLKVIAAKQLNIIFDPENDGSSYFYMNMDRI